MATGGRRDVAPIAIGLTLAAAAVHALWNRHLHATADRVATMAVANLTVGLFLAPVAIVTAPWNVWPLILVSALAEAVYGLCLATAYRQGALSIVYPLGRGVAPLVVTLLSWPLLGESPRLTTVAGAVSLAIGMTMVAMAGWRAGQTAAIGFALLTGLTISIYSVTDARAVRDTSPFGYLGVVFLLAGVALVLWIRGDRARLVGAIRPGVLVAAGGAASYLLILFAFQSAAAGSVATLREISVLIGVWLATDRLGRRVWIGAAAIAIGAMLATR